MEMSVVAKVLLLVSPPPLPPHHHQVSKRNVKWIQIGEELAIQKGAYKQTHSALYYVCAWCGRWSALLLWAREWSPEEEVQHAAQKSQFKINYKINHQLPLSLLLLCLSLCSQYSSLCAQVVSG